MLRTFPPSKYIPMPNFTKIGLAVQISIRYEYIYFVLYILDYASSSFFALAYDTTITFSAGRWYRPKSSLV